MFYWKKGSSVLVCYVKMLKTLLPGDSKTLHCALPARKAGARSSAIIPFPSRKLGHNLDCFGVHLLWLHLSRDLGSGCCCNVVLGLSCPVHHWQWTKTFCIDARFWENSRRLNSEAFSTSISWCLNVLAAKNISLFSNGSCTWMCFMSFQQFLRRKKAAQILLTY